MPSLYLALFSVAFTGLIVLAAFSILGPFLLSIVWAGIIAIAAWPMFLQLRQRLGSRSTRAALASTLVVTVTIATPMLVLLVFVVQDVAEGVAFVRKVDQEGVALPPWLAALPGVGEPIAARWDAWLGKPKAISTALESVFVEKLDAMQALAQSVLLDVTARVGILIFALWVLYFFFRDGERIAGRIHRLGYKWLPRRWPLYAHNIPAAVRSAVNGLVLVGLGESVVMSAMYAVLGVPAPVSLGTLTAIVALIPLAGPALIALIALLLFAAGKTLAALVLVTLGTAVILVAENLLRPILTKGSADMPFLLTLFGIFGGVGLMGVVGLVIGPVLLALFLVLLREGEVDEATDLEF